MHESEGTSFFFFSSLSQSDVIYSQSDVTYCNKTFLIEHHPKTYDVSINAKYSPVGD